MWLELALFAQNQVDFGDLKVLIIEEIFNRWIKNPIDQKDLRSNHPLGIIPRE